MGTKDAAAMELQSSDNPCYRSSCARLRAVIDEADLSIPNLELSESMDESIQSEMKKRIRQILKVLEGKDARQQ